MRSAAEVSERIYILKSDAALAPISTTEVDLIEAILQVCETCPNALLAERISTSTAIPIDLTAPRFLLGIHIN